MKGLHDINETTKAQLLERALYGDSYAKISRDFDINLKAVTKTLKGLGINYIPPTINKAEESIIIDKYIRRISLEAISSECGYSIPLIKKLLKEKQITKPPLISNQQKKDIIYRYTHKCYSIEKLSNTYGFSIPTIRKLLASENVSIISNRRNAELTCKQELEIVDGYLNNKSIQQLSKEYKQSREVISKLLKQHNVEVINLSELPHVPEQYWNEIIDQYEKGTSLTQLSIQYGYGRHAITNILRRANIQVINKHNLPRMNEDVFKKIDSEEKAYWLGFIYADGYIYQNSFGMALKESDRGHLEKLKIFFQYEGNLSYSPKTKSYKLQFRNKKIIHDLNALGVFQRKSKLLVFPNKKQVPKSLITHFVRGYIDGDGYVGWKAHGLGRLSILGTESMILGIVDSMHFRKSSIRKANADGCEEVKAIEWGGAYVLDYFRQLYQNASIYLDRKYLCYQTVINQRKEFLQAPKKRVIYPVKAVIQFSTSGDFMKHWSSISNAERNLNIDASSIIRACKGRVQTAGGFKWKYAEEYSNSAT